MTDSRRPVLDTMQTLQDACAIKHCLDYLQAEADRTGLRFAAHLIGVAADAVKDSIELARASGNEPEERSGPFDPRGLFGRH